MIGDFTAQFYRTRIVKEGRKRKVIISDVKITDAGIFKCTSNADETEAEVVVKCKWYTLAEIIF